MNELSDPTELVADPPEPIQRPAPGWYRDERGAQRYWDGRTWTKEIRRHDGLAVFGWITAFLFPIVGIITGIVLMARGEARGGAISAVGICVGFVGCGLVLSGGA